MYDGARSSTSSCMAPMTDRQELELAPTGVSVNALDAAVAPAMVILDAVIATGDPAHQVDFTPEHSKLVILQSNTALPNTKRMSPNSRDVELLQAADRLTEPWRRRALECVGDRSRVSCIAIPSSPRETSCSPASSRIAGSSTPPESPGGKLIEPLRGCSRPHSDMATRTGWHR